MTASYRTTNNGKAELQAMASPTTSAVAEQTNKQPPNVGVQSPVPSVHQRALLFDQFKDTVFRFA